MKEEYKLVEYTSRITVTEEPSFFENPQEAWNNLRHYLAPDNFGILYVYKKQRLPIINAREFIKAYQRKYNSEQENLFIYQWEPLFAGRACDAYTQVGSLDYDNN